MAQESTLKVKLYSSVEDVDPDILYVKYVSLVTNGTYGPPPLIAPKQDGSLPRAEDGEEVLYINTSLVPAFSITRGYFAPDEDDE